MAQIKLLDDVSTDSTTADADGFDPKGARFTITVLGTVGGSSIAIQESLDGGTTRRTMTYDDGTDVILLDNGTIEVDRLPQGYLVYAALTGGSPSGVTVVCVEG